jgi:hypothetical protein
MRDMTERFVAAVCGGIAAIGGAIAPKQVELLREGAHYALGMIGTALASMLGWTEAINRRKRGGLTLVAASLCAATVFFGTARAQETSVGTAPAQETSVGSARAPESSDTTPSDTTAVDLVALRLNDSLSREMFDTFNLFIYVDKAERGPFAQRMFVFEKSGDKLSLLYDWPVSTGRESLERDAHGHLQSTITPAGYYELDPKRLYEDHVSSQWNEEMPFAMFFDWKPNGHDTGLAIHGTAGEAANALGTRASAGCVRISQENAQTLFGLVQTQFRGSAPKIAYLDGATNVSSEGFLLHDSNGQLKFHDGYSVLVVVDDYVGNSQVSSLF